MRGVCECRAVADTHEVAFSSYAAAATVDHVVARPSWLNFRGHRSARTIASKPSATLQAHGYAISDKISCEQGRSRRHWKVGKYKRGAAYDADASQRDVVGSCPEEVEKNIGTLEFGVEVKFLINAQLKVPIPGEIPNLASFRACFNTTSNKIKKAREQEKVILYHFCSLCSFVRRNAAGSLSKV